MSAKSRHGYSGFVTGCMIGLVISIIVAFALGFTFTMLFAATTLPIFSLIHDLIYDKIPLKGNYIGPIMKSCIIWALFMPFYKFLYDVFVGNFKFSIYVFVWCMFAGFMFGFIFYMISTYLARVIYRIYD